jgi:maltose O-acetyltransferase
MEQLDYDQALDLTIDLLCSMQIETAQAVCDEVAPQLEDDRWFALLSGLAGLLAGRAGAEPVVEAERRLRARGSSVLGELTGDAPRLRRLTQAAASTMRRVEGHARVVQPTVLHGPGLLSLGEGCQFGYERSPGYVGGVGYIDCRHPGAVISIGARTVLNNDFSITSESPQGISIGADCLVGVGVKIGDSDAHGIAPHERHGSHAVKAPIVVEDNVWLGNDTSVLKGVTIGRDSVVAAGAVVTRSVPAGTIVAGVPARPVGSVYK